MPTPQSLSPRKFGITMGCVTGLLGLLLLWKKIGFSTHLLLLSGLFFITAWFAPRLLDPLKKVWMSFAFGMSWVMTRVILTLLFILVITPLSLIARVSGKDFLSLKMERESSSYWIPKKPIASLQDHYERQY